MRRRHLSPLPFPADAITPNEIPFTAENVARMVGATLGVAVLGGVFALWSNALQSLEAAMFLGGVVQLVGAAWAWNSISTAGRRRA